jgi:hypothetical protein
MLHSLTQLSSDWKARMRSWFGKPRFRLSADKLKRVCEAACRAWVEHPRRELPAWEQRFRERAAEATPPFGPDLPPPSARNPAPAGPVCGACAGTGARPGTFVCPCPPCNGAGVIGCSVTGADIGGMVQIHSRTPLDCPSCLGRGVFICDPCPTCHGFGSPGAHRTASAPASSEDWLWPDFLPQAHSLPIETGVQLMEAVMARIEMERLWPAECYALWRTAEWSKAIAHEVAPPRLSSSEEFLAYGGFEADCKLVGKQACRLVREVFGNPFRLTVLNPAWLNAEVVGQAAAAHGDPKQALDYIDPDRLAALADALARAGCDDAEILAHLRDDGPHVRGCWALDLVLAANR